MKNEYKENLKRNKCPLSSEISHSFLIEDVKKYGSIEKALIIKEIRAMNLYRIRNNFSAWVYYSERSLAKKFPYMNTKSIHRWLTELEKDGHIISCVKNKIKYDKTKSFIISEFKNKTIPQNSESVVQNEAQTPRSEATIPSHSITHSIPILGKEDFVSKTMANWNRYAKPFPGFKNLTLAKKGLPTCKVATKDLNEVLAKLVREKRTEADIARSIKNYMQEICNRNPNNDYAKHRFSLYEFLKQKNGFIKYLNK